MVANTLSKSSGPRASSVTEIAALLDKCPPNTRTLRVGWRDIAQNTYPKDFSWLLRFRGDRRKSEADNESDRDQPHGHLGGGRLGGV